MGSLPTSSCIFFHLPCKIITILYSWFISRILAFRLAKVVITKEASREDPTSSLNFLYYFRSRKKKEPKKKPAKDDGLSAKQRRKIKSQAMISSSESSDEEGGKLKIAAGCVLLLTIR